MICIADLVADSSVKLQVLGGAGALDRRVTWTHISELPEAAQWLEGGELLLTTGLGIPADAAGQVDYLASLARVGVAGIGIGQRAPELTAAFLAAGDRLGIPIMRVGVEVPFARISRIVAASNLDVSQSRLTLQIRVLETLRWWADSDVDARSLFQRLEVVTGFDIYLVDVDGAAILPGMRDAPADTVGEIPMLRTYPIINGGFGAVVPVMGRCDAFVLLQKRNNDGATGVVVARQVATVAAVQLADFLRRQEEELRRGSEVLSGMLAGERPAAPAVSYLEDRGFDLNAPLHLLAIRPRHGALDDSREVQSTFRRMRSPVVVSSTSDHLIVLAQDSLQRLTTMIESMGFVGGVSDPFPAGSDARRCHRQAIWAMRNTSGKDDALMPYARARQFAPWLNVNPETVDTIVEQVLGAVQAHDLAKGSELVHTLEVFLDHERSIAKAAQELFIHPHTLRYRLDKVEQLTGKNLAKTQDVAEFWWALQVRKMPM